MSAIDYDTFLDDIYDPIGIPAQLDCGSAGVFDLTVKNDPQGVLQETSHGLSLATSKPAVCVRVAELLSKGFSADTVRAAIVGAAITFNGATLKVHATQPKPKPNGSGELYLFLQDP